MTQGFILVLLILLTKGVSKVRNQSNLNAQECDAGQIPVWAEDVSECLKSELVLYKFTVSMTVPPSEGLFESAVNCVSENRIDINCKRLSWDVTWKIFTSLFNVLSDISSDFLRYADKDYQLLDGEEQCFSAMNGLKVEPCFLDLYKDFVSLKDLKYSGILEHKMCLKTTFRYCSDDVRTSIYLIIAEIFGNIIPETNSRILAEQNISVEQNKIHLPICNNKLIYSWSREIKKCLLDQMNKNTESFSVEGEDNPIISTKSILEKAVQSTVQCSKVHQNSNLCLYFDNSDYLELVRLTASALSRTAIIYLDTYEDVPEQVLKCILTINDGNHNILNYCIEKTEEVKREDLIPCILQHLSMCSYKVNIYLAKLIQNLSPEHIAVKLSPLPDSIQNLPAFKFSSQPERKLFQRSLHESKPCTKDKIKAWSHNVDKCTKELVVKASKEGVPKNPLDMTLELILVCVQKYKENLCSKMSNDQIESILDDIFSVLNRNLAMHQKIKNFLPDILQCFQKISVFQAKECMQISTLSLQFEYYDKRLACLSNKFDECSKEARHYLFEIFKTVTQLNSTGLHSAMNVIGVNNTSNTSNTHNIFSFSSDKILEDSHNRGDNLKDICIKENVNLWEIDILACFEKHILPMKYDKGLKPVDRIGDVLLLCSKSVHLPCYFTRSLYETLIEKIILIQHQAADGFIKKIKGSLPEFHSCQVSSDSKKLVDCSKHLKFFEKGSVLLDTKSKQCIQGSFSHCSHSIQKLVVGIFENAVNSMSNKKNDTVGLKNAPSVTDDEVIYCDDAVMEAWKQLVHHCSDEEVIKSQTPVEKSFFQKIQERLLFCIKEISERLCQPYNKENYDSIYEEAFLILSTAAKDMDKGNQHCSNNVKFDKFKRCLRQNSFKQNSIPLEIHYEVDDKCLNEVLVHCSSHVKSKVKELIEIIEYNKILTTFNGAAKFEIVGTNHDAQFQTDFILNHQVPFLNEVKLMENAKVGSQYSVESVSSLQQFPLHKSQVSKRENKSDIGSSKVNSYFLKFETEQDMPLPKKFSSSYDSESKITTIGNNEVNEPNINKKKVCSDIIIHHWIRNIKDCINYEMQQYHSRVSEISLESVSARTLKCIRLTAHSGCYHTSVEQFSSTVRNLLKIVMMAIKEYASNYTGFVQQKSVECIKVIDLVTVKPCIPSLYEILVIVENNPHSPNVTAIMKQESDNCVSTVFQNCTSLARIILRRIITSLVYEIIPCISSKEEAEKHSLITDDLTPDVGSVETDDGIFGTTPIMINNSTEFKATLSLRNLPTDSKNILISRTHLCNFEDLLIWMEYVEECIDNDVAIYISFNNVANSVEDALRKITSFAVSCIHHIGPHLCQTMNINVLDKTIQRLMINIENKIIDYLSYTGKIEASRMEETCIEHFEHHYVKHCVPLIYETVGNDKKVLNSQFHKIIEDKLKVCLNEAFIPCSSAVRENIGNLLSSLGRMSNFMHAFGDKYNNKNFTLYSDKDAFNVSKFSYSVWTPRHTSPTLLEVEKRGITDDDDFPFINPEVEGVKAGVLLCSPKTLIPWMSAFQRCIIKTSTPPQNSRESSIYVRVAEDSLECVKQIGPIKCIAPKPKFIMFAISRITRTIAALVETNTEKSVKGIKYKVNNECLSLITFPNIKTCGFILREGAPGVKSRDQIRDEFLKCMSRVLDLCEPQVRSLLGDTYFLATRIGSEQEHSSQNKPAEKGGSCLCPTDEEPHFKDLNDCRNEHIQDWVDVVKHCTTEDLSYIVTASPSVDKTGSLFIISTLASIMACTKQTPLEECRYSTFDFYDLSLKELFAYVENTLKVPGYGEDFVKCTEKISYHSLQSCIPDLYQYSSIGFIASDRSLSWSMLQKQVESCLENLFKFCSHQSRILLFEILEVAICAPPPLKVTTVFEQVRDVVITEKPTFQRKYKDMPVESTGIPLPPSIYETHEPAKDSGIPQHGYAFEIESKHNFSGVPDVMIPIEHIVITEASEVPSFATPIYEDKDVGSSGTPVPKHKDYISATTKASDLPRPAEADYISEASYDSGTPAPKHKDYISVSAMASGTPVPKHKDYISASTKSSDRPRPAEPDYTSEASFDSDHPKPAEPDYRSEATFDSDRPRPAEPDYASEATFDSEHPRQAQPDYTSEATFHSELPRPAEPDHISEASFDSGTPAPKHKDDISISTKASDLPRPAEPDYISEASFDSGTPAPKHKDDISISAKASDLPRPAEPDYTSEASFDSGTPKAPENFEDFIPTKISALPMKCHTFSLTHPNTSFIYKVLIQIMDYSKRNQCKSSQKKKWVDNFEFCLSSEYKKFYSSYNMKTINETIILKIILNCVPPATEINCSFTEYEEFQDIFMSLMPKIQIYTINFAASASELTKAEVQKCTNTLTYLKWNQCDYSIFSFISSNDVRNVSYMVRQILQSYACMRNVFFPCLPLTAELFIKIIKSLTNVWMPVSLLINGTQSMQLVGNIVNVTSADITVCEEMDILIPLKTNVTSIKIFSPSSMISAFELTDAPVLKFEDDQDKVLLHSRPHPEMLVTSNVVETSDLITDNKKENYTLISTEIFMQTEDTVKEKSSVISTDIYMQTEETKGVFTPMVHKVTKPTKAKNYTEGICDPHKVNYYTQLFIICVLKEANSSSQNSQRDSQLIVAIINLCIHQTEFSDCIQEDLFVFNRTIVAIFEILIPYFIKITEDTTDLKNCKNNLLTLKIEQCSESLFDYAKYVRTNFDIDSNSVRYFKDANLCFNKGVRTCSPISREMIKNIIYLIMDLDLPKTFQTTFYFNENEVVKQYSRRPICSKQIVQFHASSVNSCIKDRLTLYHDAIKKSNVSLSIERTLWVALACTKEYALDCHFETVNSVTKNIVQTIETARNIFLHFIKKNVSETNESIICHGVASCSHLEYCNPIIADYLSKFTKSNSSVSLKSASHQADLCLKKELSTCSLYVQHIIKLIINSIIGFDFFFYNGIDKEDIAEIQKSLKTCTGKNIKIWEKLVEVCIKEKQMKIGLNRTIIENKNYESNCLQESNICIENVGNVDCRVKNSDMLHQVTSSVLNLLTVNFLNICNTVNQNECAEFSPCLDSLRSEKISMCTHNFLNHFTIVEKRPCMLHAWRKNRKANTCLKDRFKYCSSEIQVIMHKIITTVMGTDILISYDEEISETTPSSCYAINASNPNTVLQYKILDKMVTYSRQKQCMIKQQDKWILNIKLCLDKEYEQWKFYLKAIPVSNKDIILNLPLSCVQLSNIENCMISGWQNFKHDFQKLIQNFQTNLKLFSDIVSNITVQKYVKQCSASLNYQKWENCTSIVFNLLSSLNTSNFNFFINQMNLAHACIHNMVPQCPSYVIQLLHAIIESLTGIEIPSFLTEDFIVNITKMNNASAHCEIEDSTTVSARITEIPSLSSTTYLPVPDDCFIINVTDISRPIEYRVFFQTIKYFERQKCVMNKQNEWSLNLEVCLLEAYDDFLYLSENTISNDMDSFHNHALKCIQSSYINNCFINNWVHFKSIFEFFLTRMQTELINISFKSQNSVKEKIKECSKSLALNNLEKCLYGFFELISANNSINIKSFVNEIHQSYSCFKKVFLNCSFFGIKLLLTLINMLTNIELPVPSADVHFMKSNLSGVILKMGSNSLTICEPRTSHTTEHTAKEKPSHMSTSLKLSEHIYKSTSAVSSKIAIVTSPTKQETTTSSELSTLNTKGSSSLTTIGSSAANIAKSSTTIESSISASAKISSTTTVGFSNITISKPTTLTTAKSSSTTKAEFSSTTNGEPSSTTKVESSTTKVESSTTKAEPLTIISSELSTISDSTIIISVRSEPSTITTTGPSTETTTLGSTTTTELSTISDSTIIIPVRSEPSTITTTGPSTVTTTLGSTTTTELSTINTSESSTIATSGSSAITTLAPSTITTSKSSIATTTELSAISTSGSSTVTTSGPLTITSAEPSAATAASKSTIELSTITAAEPSAIEETSTATTVELSTISRSESSTVTTSEPSTISTTGSSTMTTIGSSIISTAEPSILTAPGPLTAAKSSTITTGELSTITAPTTVPESSTTSKDELSSITTSELLTKTTPGSSTITTTESSPETELSTIYSTGSSTVTASDFSTATILESSTVISVQSSTISQSSTITSVQSSTISQPSTVTSAQSSTIVPVQPSAVTAFESSTIVPVQSSAVTAIESSIATSSEPLIESTATAAKSSAVTMLELLNVTTTKSLTIKAPSTITIPGPSETTKTSTVTATGFLSITIAEPLNTSAIHSTISVESSTAFTEKPSTVTKLKRSIPTMPSTASELVNAMTAKASTITETESSHKTTIFSNEKCYIVNVTKPTAPPKYKLISETLEYSKGSACINNQEEKWLLAIEMCLNKAYKEFSASLIKQIVNNEDTIMKVILKCVDTSEGINCSFTEWLQFKQVFELLIPKLQTSLINFSSKSSDAVKGKIKKCANILTYQNWEHCASTIFNFISANKTSKYYLLTNETFQSLFCIHSSFFTCPILIAKLLNNVVRKLTNIELPMSLIYNNWTQTANSNANITEVTAGTIIICESQAITEPLLEIEDDSCGANGIKHWIEQLANCSKEMKNFTSFNDLADTECISEKGTECIWLIKKPKCNYIDPEELKIVLKHTTNYLEDIWVDHQNDGRRHQLTKCLNGCISNHALNICVEHFFKFRKGLLTLKEDANATEESHKCIKDLLKHCKEVDRKLMTQIISVLIGGDPGSVIDNKRNINGSDDNLCDIVHQVPKSTDNGETKLKAKVSNCKAEESESRIEIVARCTKQETKIKASKGKKGYTIDSFVRAILKCMKGTGKLKCYFDDWNIYKSHIDSIIDLVRHSIREDINKMHKSQLRLDMQKCVDQLSIDSVKSCILYKFDHSTDNYSSTFEKLETKEVKNDQFAVCMKSVFNYCSQQMTEVLIELIGSFVVWDSNKIANVGRLFKITNKTIDSMGRLVCEIVYYNKQYILPKELEEQLIEEDYDEVEDSGEQDFFSNSQRAFNLQQQQSKDMDPFHQMEFRENEERNSASDFLDDESEEDSDENIDENNPYRKRTICTEEIMDKILKSIDDCLSSNISLVEFGSENSPSEQMLLYLFECTKNASTIVCRHETWLIYKSSVKRVFKMAKESFRNYELELQKETVRKPERCLKRITIKRSGNCLPNFFIYATTIMNLPNASIDVPRSLNDSVQCLHRSFIPCSKNALKIIINIMYIMLQINPNYIFNSSVNRILLEAESLHNISIEAGNVDGNEQTLFNGNINFSAGVDVNIPTFNNLLPKSAKADVNFKVPEFQKYLKPINFDSKPLNIEIPPIFQSELKTIKPNSKIVHGDRIDVSKVSYLNPLSDHRKVEIPNPKAPLTDKQHLKQSVPSMHHADSNPHAVHVDVIVHDVHEQESDTQHKDIDLHLLQANVHHETNNNSKETFPHHEKL